MSRVTFSDVLIVIVPCENVQRWLTLAAPCENCLRACAKYTYLDSSYACAKSRPGICSPFVQSIVSNESVSGQ